VGIDPEVRVVRFCERDGVGLRRLRSLFDLFPATAREIGHPGVPVRSYGATRAVGRPGPDRVAGLIRAGTESSTARPVTSRLPDRSLVPWSVCTSRPFPRELLSRLVPISRTQKILTQLGDPLYGLWPLAKTPVLSGPSRMPTDDV
jgi:hypothetical protein